MLAMFKEKCPRCRRETSKKFSFCPYCGCNLEEEREIEDFGILGKKDKSEIMPNAFGFNLNIGEIFKSVNSLMKDATKNFEKNIGEPKVFTKAISIDLSPGKRPVIKVSSNGKPMQAGMKKEFARSIKLPKMSKESLEEFSKLPKEEPKAEVRRIGDLLIYELNTPGVKGKEDIMINRLEKGVEIIAKSKEKAYVKKLPLKLEVLDYSVSDEKVLIEFKV